MKLLVLKTLKLKKQKMVIKIKSDIFSDMNNLADVNYLIRIFAEDNRYSFFCDIKVIQETGLFKSLFNIDKELIEEYYSKHINQSSTMDYFIGIDSTDIDFNLNEAKRFFNQPLIIILENSLNDGYFVNAVIKNFKKKGKQIHRHKGFGWLTYENGGGLNNISNYIKGLLDRYSDLPKPQNKYLRCFVLFDSDRNFPKELPNNARKDLIKFLNDNQIEFIQLEKREIENYLPDDVLKSLNNEYINCYLDLNPEQKDYFDIEYGFHNKNFESLSQEVKDLYNDIDKEKYKILRKGIDIDAYSKGSKFKSEFVKLFSNEEVSQISLKHRTNFQNNPLELEQILEKINTLL